VTHLCTIRYGLDLELLFAPHFHIFDLVSIDLLISNEVRLALMNQEHILHLHTLVVNHHFLL